MIYVKVLLTGLKFCFVLSLKIIKNKDLITTKHVKDKTVRIIKRTHANN